MSQERRFQMPGRQIGELEDVLLAEGVETIIGVDEAGRGPLAGPVHAGAFWMDLREPMPLAFADLDDSKKLTEPVRESLFEKLQSLDCPQAIGISDASVVDEINVLQATFRAMTAAVDEVIARKGDRPDLVLIDGNLIIASHNKWKQRPVIKGDTRSVAIAAASILAKVSRDRVMRQAHDRWPDYGFNTNKGYGTKAHREALRMHGPCALHRRSFAGVVIDAKLS